MHGGLIGYAFDISPMCYDQQKCIDTPQRTRSLVSKSVVQTERHGRLIVISGIIKLDMDLKNDGKHSLQWHDDNSRFDL